MQELSKLNVGFITSPECAERLDTSCRALFRQRTAWKLALVLSERDERLCGMPGVQLGLCP